MRFAFTHNKSERESTLYKETRIKVLNQSDESWDHVNTCDVKFDIDGRVHVLLYSFRRIKKGEYLYYDYNAGGSSTYPTEEFV